MTERRSRTLAFSTLACPEWDAETVVARAISLGFGGVEWRGGADGTVRPDWSADRRRALRRLMDDSGLVSIAVTAYTDLIAADPAVRQASIAAIADHAALASDLGAPVVRIFLGVADDGAAENVVIDRAAAALAGAIPLADDRGASLAIEPHDEHVRAAAVRPILDAVDDPRLGIVWDIANAWAACDDPAVGLAAYGRRIRYVQVKDGTGNGATWRLCSIGTGDVPLERALRLLAESVAVDGRSLPPISVEWERAWHPELAPADVALPEALAWLDRHVATTPWTSGRTV